MSASVTTPKQVLEALTFNLYSKLCAGNDNVFYSPFSLANALGMAYAAAGSKSTTAAEFEKILSFHPGIHEFFQKTKDALEKRRLSVANGAWLLAKIFPQAKKEYLQLITQFYGKDALHNLDLKTGVTDINNWVAQATKRTIPTLIDNLDPLTILVLTNAIFFHGEWLHPFDAKLTKAGVPWNNGAKNDKCDLMSMGKNIHCYYTEEKTYQAIELPYREGLSMVVVLPAKDSSLPALEKDLTPAFFTKVTTNLKAQMCEIYMPKFSFADSFELKTVLEKLGLVIPFNMDKADFTGLVEKRVLSKLAISRVIHKACIDLDETGTTAAAASAVELRTKSKSFAKPEPVKIFRADRPFAYFIREKDSGVLVFCGRLYSPGQKAKQAAAKPAPPPPHTTTTHAATAAAAAAPTPALRPGCRLRTSVSFNSPYVRWNRKCCGGGVCGGVATRLRTSVSFNSPSVRWNRNLFKQQSSSSTCCCCDGKGTCTCKPRQLMMMTSVSFNSPSVKWVKHQKCVVQSCCCCKGDKQGQGQQQHQHQAGDPPMYDTFSRSFNSPSVKFNHHLQPPSPLRFSVSFNGPSVHFKLRS